MAKRLRRSRRLLEQEGRFHVLDDPVLNHIIEFVGLDDRICAMISQRFRHLLTDRVRPVIIYPLNPGNPRFRGYDTVFIDTPDKNYPPPPKEVWTNATTLSGAVRPCDIAAAGKHGKITDLAISRRPLSKLIPRAVKYLPDLEIISLSQVSLHDIRMGVLSPLLTRFPKLYCLDLERMDFVSFKTLILAANPMSWRKGLTIVVDPISEVLCGWAPFIPILVRRMMGSLATIVLLSTHLCECHSGIPREIEQSTNVFIKILHATKT